MRRASVAALAVLLAGCGGGAPQAEAPKRITVTIDSAGGAHAFSVEVARTVAEQARGLMYRTSIPEDGGMLFAPYPPEGGGPREASFWMKNTPHPLDILFIRSDRTIARIADNAVPMSEVPIASGEPVSAVLEIGGGRAAELGIAEGDRVRWTQP